MAGTKLHPLRVFLLTVGSDGRAPRFDPEMPEAPEADGVRTGFRGRVEGWFRRAKDRWRGAHGGVAGLTKRVWEWLHRGVHPDEALYGRLRRASAVEVRHPPGMSAEEAGRAWSAFLKAGRRRHAPRFVLNALVAPLAVVLAVLPGPNVVGYWFAYRAVHHLLILVGISRARSGRVETRFRPCDRTVGDRPRPDGGDDRTASLGCVGGGSSGDG